MNQDFTAKLEDAICGDCRCKGQQFLHNVWYENKIQRICTSCALFKLFEFYCPTCFAVHDYPSLDMICCDNCKSHSHPSCFPSKSRPSGAPSMCSTCKNPSRLIFFPRESKTKGENGKGKWMDKNASTLLLTAAKITTMLMRKRGEELDDFITKKIKETLEERGEANDLLLKAMGHMGDP